MALNGAGELPVNERTSELATQADEKNTAAGAAAAPGTEAAAAEAAAAGVAGDFALVCDSASDLPLSWCDTAGVELVALHLKAGSSTVRDVYDVKIGDIPEAERAHIHVTPPTEAEYAAAFERARQAGATNLICVTVSAAISKSFAHAQAAADKLKDHVRVVVLDSKSGSVGEALLVRSLVAWRDEGTSFETALHHALDLVGRITMLAMMPADSPILQGNLRSTPLGKAQRQLVRALGLTALVTFDEQGNLITTGVYRDARVPAERMKRLIYLDAEREGALYHLTMFAGNNHGLEMLRRYVRASGEQKYADRVTEASEGMALLVGQGASAVAYVGLKRVPKALVKHGAGLLSEDVLQHQDADVLEEIETATFPTDGLPA